MASNFQGIVARVKEAHSIEDYIASSGVVLKQNGATKLKGLCPLPDHNENTPSFSVDIDFQNYYCFGCKGTGDIISYVQVTENLSFMEALQSLAAAKGIEIEAQSDEPSVDYASLRAIVKAAALFYVAHFKRLDSDHPAKSQITDRGLSLDVLSFGYAPEKRGSLYAFLKSKGFSDDLIHDSGVCRRSEKGSFYDFWNGRLMFVIADIQGNPIGFSGRKLFEDDKRGKYVNSIDGPLFNKSKALFNVSRAKKAAGQAKELYVVEGQFDVAAFNEAGLANVIAASGTSFTDSHAQTASRLVSREQGAVVFCMDGDAAGITAAERIFKTAPSLHSIAFAVPFEEGDPSDYRQANGNEALVEHVTKTRVPLVDFVLQNLEARSDLSSTTGRARYVKEAAELIACVKSRPILDSAARRIALYAVSSHAAVMSEIKEAVKENRVREKRASSRAEERRAEAAEDEEPLPPPPEDYDDERDDEPDTPTNVQPVTIAEHRDDPDFMAAARFVALTVRFKRLRPALVSAKRLLPPELQPFSDDMKSILDSEDESPRMIPETFTHVELARDLFSPGFLPHLRAMSSQEVVALYRRLLAQLRETRARESKQDRRSQIVQVLSDSGGGTIEDLKRALALEENGEVG